MFIFMKIKALKDFFTNGHKGFQQGVEYDVTDEFGAILIERELATELVVKPTEKPQSVESVKSNNEPKKLAKKQ